MMKPPDASTWPEYIGHKIVRAAVIVRIDDIGENTETTERKIYVDPLGPDPLCQRLPTLFEPTERVMKKHAEIGGFAVVYSENGGYGSISPRVPFEGGYKRYEGAQPDEEPRPGGGKSPQILMSKENPDGWKLEDLLTRLREELDRKNDRLSGDTHPIARGVLQSNRRIIALLNQAEQLQREALRYLDTLGPDQGPRGTPRVGPGAETKPAANPDLLAESVSKGDEV